jgi:hypothetical protein
MQKSNNKKRLPQYNSPMKIEKCFYCIENLTFILLIILVFMVAYLYYAFFYKTIYNLNVKSDNTIKPIRPIQIDISTGNHPEYDGPPLRNDGAYFPSDSGKIPVVEDTTKGIAINIETRGRKMDYSQVGILTRTGNKEMILPLMGRKQMIGLDKWQYYTVSNTGVVNTRLPIRYKGRSCTSENGCDYLNSGDMVYVEGYDDIFRVTIYENTQFQYIPYI